MADLSEREKMLRGEPYLAFDPELLRLRNEAKQLCFELNQAPPNDPKQRQIWDQQILHVPDALVESPFQVDYGYPFLKVGRNFYANHGCTLLDGGSIIVGDNCLLGPHVCISTAGHPLEAAPRAAGIEFCKPIVLGNNVWIGANATICPNVTIGDNVVVAAGAVVVRNVPSNTVVGGVPAKVIKTLAANSIENEEEDEEKDIATS